MPKPTAKSFQATLERGGGALNWVIVRIPFDVSKLWGKRGQLRVRGEINGFVFRTSLFPTGDGRHILLVNKGMQKGGRAGLGVTARFRLAPDTEKRKVAMPLELKSAFEEVPPLRRWYEQLNPSWRREIANWVADVKSAAARVRRTEQIVERMLATMEAERELPPILRLAFARDARAEEGWKRMPAAPRRRHLFAIFYYRTPDGRARRVAKILEEAHKYAEKSRTKEVE
jgi:uncharacterized protein YdeI (YjbR/CyaY-like superfamily)